MLLGMPGSMYSRVLEYDARFTARRHRFSMDRSRTFRISAECADLVGYLRCIHLDNASYSILISGNTKIPTEFKHITKWRKRNIIGLAQ